MLNENTLRNHYNLSRECGEVTRALCEDDEARFFRLDRDRPEFPRLMADCRYPVSAWPLLLSTETINRFTEIVREVPSLIFRAARRCYEYAPRRFRARYPLPDLAYERLCDAGEPTNVLVRWDFVLVDNVPKLLEANVGSRAGGWRSDWFWPQLAEMIRHRPGSEHWKLSHTNILDMFCRYMHRAVRAHVKQVTTGNILVIFAPYFFQYGFDEELSALYDQTLAGTAHPGRLLFDDNVDSLTIRNDGRIEYRGDVIDGIMGTSEHATIPPEMNEAHLKRMIFYPDNELHLMLDDKSNFATLCQAKAAGWLDEHDARLVEDYVPWTALLTTDPVEWEGEKVSARDLALASKDALVLKRGVSCQGKDVYVGRFLSPEEWSTVIERAGTSGDWVIQAYCPPDRLYAPNGESVVTEHEAVWGVFGLGGEYGGVFGRLMEPDRGCGVVNVARGATMAVVLEV